MLVILPFAVVLAFAPYAVGYASFGGSAVLPLVVEDGIVLFVLVFGMRVVRNRMEELKDYMGSTLEAETPLATSGLYAWKGPLVCFAVLTAVLAPTFALSSSGVPAAVNSAQTPAWLFFSAIFGNYIWMYGYSMVSMYRAGRNSLKLRPFTEDKALGLKPFGSASFQFSAVYFLIVIGAWGLGNVIYYANFPIEELLALITVFLSAGILLFIIPLLSLRRQLQGAKKRETRWLGMEYTKLVQRMKSTPKPTPEEDILFSSKLTSLDKLQRDVKQIRTWPFDVQILERFIAIIASVVAITIANFVKLLL